VGYGSVGNLALPGSAYRSFLLFARISLIQSSNLIRRQVGQRIRFPSVPRTYTYVESCHILRAALE
jgi:hypothetical protein